MKNIVVTQKQNKLKNDFFFIYDLQIISLFIQDQKYRGRLQRLVIIS